jgi:hypothetical protein
MVFAVTKNKGYAWELACKHELEDKFGKGNVLKTTRWTMFGDFFVIVGNMIVLIVECKKTVKKKWKPRYREILQAQAMIKFCSSHSIRGEYWIKEAGVISKVCIQELNEVYPCIQCIQSGENIPVKVTVQ